MRSPSLPPLRLALRPTYGISQLMMGLMVIHGAQGGGFSPISIYGGITNRIVAQADLPLSEMTTFLASLVVNLAVAVVLFFAFGGRRLLSQRDDSAIAAGDAPRAVNVPHVEIATPQAGAQIYGDAEAQAITEEIALETGQAPSLTAEHPTEAATRERGISNGDHPPGLSRLPSLHSFTSSISASLRLLSAWLSR